MKAKISSIVIFTFIFLSTAVIAQKPMQSEKKGSRPEMTSQRMKKPDSRPDFLTAEQKESMKTLRLETEKELKPLRNQLREAMAHQQTLSTAEDADLKAINKNIDKMAEIKAEMAKIKAKQHQAFRAQLTEEQLIMFDSRKDHMKRTMKNRDRGNRADGRTPGMNKKGA